MNKTTTILLYVFILLSLVSCKTTFKGDYKSLYNGLDICEAEYCTQVDKEFQKTVTRYESQGALKERDMLVKEQREWLEFRQRVCNYASEGFKAGKVWPSCYWWQSEERYRYLRRGDYIAEHGWPTCVAENEHYSYEGGLTYRDAVTRSECDVRCNKENIEWSKQKDIWATCRYGDETLHSYKGIPKPEKPKPTPTLPRMDFTNSLRP